MWKVFFPLGFFWARQYFEEKPQVLGVLQNPNADILDNPTGPVLGGPIKKLPPKKHHCPGQVQTVGELRNSSKTFIWEDHRGLWKWNIFWHLLKWLKRETTRTKVNFSFSSRCECNLLQHSPWELPPTSCPKEDLEVKLSFHLYQNKQRQGQAARGMKSQLSATPKYFLLEQFVSWQT